MDSLTHIAFGSAIGIAAMRGRTAPWKAALVGAVCNTLPDLDVFIDHGDAIRNVTLHRGDSHALFWLTLVSPVVALLAASALRDLGQYRRWWLAVWLCLVSHPLLDVLTVYGTQILRPFTDVPYAIGSIFIIDPLFTLPLIIGVVVALVRRDLRGWRWAVAGLAVSLCYLAWGVAAQAIVRQTAQESLRAQGIVPDKLLVTPTALNTVLWRVVAVTPDRYLEGFRSLLDRTPQIAFQSHPRGEALTRKLADDPNVQRIARFTQDLYKLSERDRRIVITDLRMGQEPYYSFNYVIGRQEGDAVTPVRPMHFREQHDIRTGLAWLWRRALGEELPPPQ